MTDSEQSKSFDWQNGAWKILKEMLTSPGFLIQHQIGPFNDFLDKGLPNVIEQFNPITLNYDFITEQKFFKFKTDSKYYENAFNFYKKLLKNPSFHIFTNDIRLSKKIIFQISKNKDILFLRDYNFSDIEEFSLFSKYNYAIIANSTFSLMSSYLSFDRKISVAPSIWLKKKKLDKKKIFSKLKFI